MCLTICEWGGKGYSVFHYYWLEKHCILSPGGILNRIPAGRPYRARNSWSAPRLRAWMR